MVTAQRVIVSCLVWLTILSYAPAQVMSGTVHEHGATPTKVAVSPGERIAWFREAKFGMFIHWGLYSVLGGEWQGKQMPIPSSRAEGGVGRYLADDNVELIMENLRIPLAEYREVGRQFNPVKFDAQQWVSMIKATGMKYMVITAKHEDGFAMFHSKVSKYNIVDATPFKRDPMKELAEACRREGIRLCFYYAQRIDYEDPNSYSNYWDYHEVKRDYAKYFDGKAKGQVRELLTGYGPLGIIWFDDRTYTPQQAKEMADLVHSIQPRCLVDGRVGSFIGKEPVGDYDVLGDHELPPGEVQEYFETPQTLNHSWCYNKFDNDWKPPREVIHELVDVVSKGGNYLLDVGPTGDGTFPQPAVDILHKVGEWMERNGESIYGTSPCPLGQLPWGRCTVKGEKLYLHVFDWPQDGELSLVRLKNDVKRAYLFADSSRAVDFSRGEGKLSVWLPGAPVDEEDTVVVLEIAGRPEVDPPVVVQEGNSSIKLDYVTAVTAGKAIKRHTTGGGYHISNWEDPQDSVTWGMKVDQPGRYQVWITYSALRQWEGPKYRVSVGSASLEETVHETPYFAIEGPPPAPPRSYHYQTFNIGIVDLPQAGDCKLTIRPVSSVGHNLMYFKSIELTQLH
jgi:alpha-L-fucosidase